MSNMHEWQPGPPPCPTTQCSSVGASRTEGSCLAQLVQHARSQCLGGKVICSCARRGHASCDDVHAQAAGALQRFRRWCGRSSGAPSSAMHGAQPARSAWSPPQSREAPQSEHGMMHSSPVLACTRSTQRRSRRCTDRGEGGKRTVPRSAVRRPRAPRWPGGRPRGPVGRGRRRRHARPAAVAPSPRAPAARAPPRPRSSRPAVPCCRLRPRAPPASRGRVPRAPQTSRAAPGRPVCTRAEVGARHGQRRTQEVQVVASQAHGRLWDTG